MRHAEVAETSKSVSLSKGIASSFEYEIFLCSDRHRPSLAGYDGIILIVDFEHLGRGANVFEGLQDMQANQLDRLSLLVNNYDANVAERRGLSLAAVLATVKQELTMYLRWRNLMDPILYPQAPALPVGLQVSCTGVLLLVENHTQHAVISPGHWDLDQLLCQNEVFPLVLSDVTS